VIFESLRFRVAGMLLRGKTAKIKRQKELFDFASAKYVGVLCSPQNETDTEHVKVFLQYLSQKGIRYSVLGYFDGKKIPENFLYWKGMDFITRQDLDFFFMPQGAIVDKFVSEPFEMLINCNIAGYFSMECIAQLSVAKCKVGVMHDEKMCCDLTIDIQKNKSVEYFLKNLEKYFSNLKYSQV